MESLVSQHNLEKAFTGKRVFVTGHTGFKGSWLITWLQLLGAEIQGYALAPETGKNIFNIIAPHVAHNNIVGDIRDKEKLRKEITDFKPDFIFHLAAQALVRRSYAIPAETFNVNIIGTANVLEALIGLSYPCVTIIVTTDKVYENKGVHTPYKETDRLGGFDPYSASKACAEIVTDSFIQSFFNIEKIKKHQKIIASVRAGNVIGGGDYSADRIVPDIINHLKQNKEIPVRNPQAIRPWQYVLEPLGGYLLCAAKIHEKPVELSRSYNFGPDEMDHLTVRELVEIAIKKWGRGTWKNVSKAGQLHEAGLLKLNTDRARRELQWYPKLNSKKAIEWTLDWYKQEHEIYNFTLQQIKDYQSL